MKKTYKAQYTDEKGNVVEVTRKSEREYKWFWYFYATSENNKNIAGGMYYRQGRKGFASKPTAVPSVGDKCCLGTVVCSGCIPVEVK